MRENNHDRLMLSNRQYPFTLYLMLVHLFNAIENRYHTYELYFGEFQSQAIAYYTH